MVHFLWALLITAILRLFPLLFYSQYGIDQWFFLLFIRKLKSSKKFPVTLDNFILENNEQWYPPLFPIILSVLPLAALKKWGTYISCVFDLFQLGLLYCVVYNISSMNRLSLVVCLVYAFTPFLIFYNVQLNPRIVGSLFLTICLLLVNYALTHGNYFMFGAAVMIGILVLLTHKMTTQLLWVMFISFFVVHKDPRYLYLLFMISAGALVLSGGFYLKMLRSHWDTVLFWHRHIADLSKNQYYESKHYAKKDYVSAATFQNTAKNYLQHCVSICAANPFVILAGFYIINNMRNFDSMQSFFAEWVIITYCLICATIFINPLRCFGYGVLYVVFACFPVAFFSGRALMTGEKQYLILGGIVLFIAVAKILRLFIQFKQNKYRSSVGKDLRQLFEFVKTLPGKIVLTIPHSLANAGAYFSDKKFVAGGHGYGFNDKLHYVYPVFELTLSSIFKKYDVEYLIVDNNYVKNSDIERNSDDMEKLKKLKQFNNYVIYAIKDSELIKKTS